MDKTLEENRLYIHTGDEEIEPEVFEWYALFLTESKMKASFMLLDKVRAFQVDAILQGSTHSQKLTLKGNDNGN